jgi:hypothetical protein
MAISTEEAMASYGYVFQLANAIPELKGFLDQAIQGGWTPDKLNATIRSSPWYMHNADTARNLVTMQATDPSTYNLNVTNAEELINLKAAQLGRRLAPGVSRQLALRVLTTNAGWDDGRLTALVVASSQLARGDAGAYLGSAADIITHLKQIYTNYGVPFTEQWMQFGAFQIQSGLDTVEGFENAARNRAKLAYPQFAAQFDAGQTLRDIADPYIGQMAQTLEIPETQVDLNDPYIKKALATTASDGVTQKSMPLWQFARTLKDDPRYDKTLQAKDDAFSTLAKIGKDWGFVGASG